ncbi:MAG: DUF371 domain-containing protein [Methanoregulaceae archaeon]|nr:DUF371 domain-containing protein [Methanoregulaceae archaeon]
MTCTEVIYCRGHRNVTALHRTTFEITAEDRLTPGGDCIIGIGAGKGLPGLSPHFRSLLARDDAELVTLLSCGGIEVCIRSSGSRAMTLDHSSDLVWRKSSFVCGRTVGIRSDTAACDLPREMIDRLKEGRDLAVVMTVTVPSI